MKKYRHFIIPPLALLCQALPILFLRYLPLCFYGDSRMLPEAWERPITLLGLSFFAGLSLLLANLGIYWLLTRSRLWVATPLIILCCVPALIGGMVYLHGLLIFLTLV